MRAWREEANGSVQFRGWTEDVAAFLEEIDLLVVPSVNDNLPRVIMEAFAAGVTVLAFDAGAFAFSVAKDVGESFLDDTEDGHFDFFGHAGENVGMKRQ